MIEPVILDDLVQHFEAATLAPAQFGHREHLRVAWCYLRALPLEDALARYVRGLQRLTGALGVPHKFHRTLTWLWVAQLHAAMQRFPGLALDELIAACPSLVDRDTPYAYYTRAELATERARRQFVLPGES